MHSIYSLFFNYMIKLVATIGNHRPRIGCQFFRMVANENLATVTVEP